VGGGGESDFTHVGPSNCDISVNNFPEVFFHLFVSYFCRYFSVSLNEALLCEFLVPKTKSVARGQERQLGYIVFYCSVLCNKVSVFLIKIA